MLLYKLGHDFLDIQYIEYISVFPLASLETSLVASTSLSESTPDQLLDFYAYFIVSASAGRDEDPVFFSKKKYGSGALYLKRR